MILVDTSVLINYFKGKDTSSTAIFDGLIANKLEFGVSEFIVQEVLQGTRNKSEFEKLKKYLETQIIYQPQLGLESYIRASELYFKCRQKGITIRSSVDCLISEIAIENNLFLLHDDSDYNQIAKISDLKIYPLIEN